MSIFNVLSLIGGLCLFLFGMNIMGQSLERRAGGSLKTLLGKLTDKKAAGLLTGLGVTAVIQSSSATTVMVVGFVNSGLMSLKQSINVIMGANIGTTVTAWILSLAGNRQQQRIYQTVKAIVIYTGTGFDRNYFIHVLQEGQQKGYRHDIAGICNIDVWHGSHEQRGVCA